MHNIKVKWTEQVVSDNTLMDTFPDEDWTLAMKEYSGTILDTNSNFWGTTYATVACDDGRVRTVNIDQLTIIKD